jgi:hypothetical protein
MTLKIRPVAGKREIRIYLSGQLRTEHVEQLKSEVERGGPSVTLDLEELELVDIEGFAFSTRVSRQALQSCTVRLISGPGCGRSEMG